VSSIPDPATTDWVPVWNNGPTSTPPMPSPVVNGQWIKGVGGAAVWAPLAPYGTSLPASPVDGDEAVLVDSVTNPSYSWRFRYNAQSTSAYKWECVGGAPASVGPSGGGAVGNTGTAFVSSGGPYFTLPRPGDYLISVAAELNSGNAIGVSGNAMMSFRLAGGGTTYSDGIYTGVGGTYWRFASNPMRKNGCPAAQVEAMYSSWNAASSNFNFCILTVQPVRVS